MKARILTEFDYGNQKGEVFTVLPGSIYPVTKTQSTGVLVEIDQMLISLDFHEYELIEEDCIADRRSTLCP